MNQFKPKFGLKNPHVQSILSSVGPRRWLENHRAKIVTNASTHRTLETPQGVKLVYDYTPNPSSKGLAVLLHGWEGSSDSLYVLSAARALFENGYCIARLNLRDHGPSHHLNEKMFNSTLLEEVAEGVKWLCDQHGGAHNLMVGYSLGGNFTLRVSAVAKAMNINLQQAIAVCPVLHPPTTMKALNEGAFIYEKYFVKKWKQSLRKKVALFDQYDFGGQLDKMKSLDEMNDFFINNFTDFETPSLYFEAYAVIGDVLKTLSFPTTIITSADDPMIPTEQLRELYPSDHLNIEVQPYGGHCAFIKNWKLESWASERIVELATQPSNETSTSTTQMGSELA
jgi:predicted alpha/beta-fold hydrolase